MGITLQLILQDLIVQLAFVIWNRYIDSERRFQHVLEACGVNKSLIKLGVKDGDTVIVGDVSLFYVVFSYLQAVLLLS